MMRIRQRTRQIGTALLAITACLATSAYAQIAPKTISVEVAILTRVLAGRTGVEAPADQVTLTHLVSYEDLDLTTQSGVEELHRRIAETARFACEQLERLYPRQSESLARCTNQALEDTASQVDAAVEAAEREASGE